MKKLLIPFLLLSTSSKAELTSDQASYLRTANIQKYEQFLNGEEIEINVSDLALLMLKTNIDTCQKLIYLKPISYEDVSELMTYENYLDFIPRYIEHCQYQKKWKKYMNDISQGIFLGSIIGMANYRKLLSKEPMTIKNFLKNAGQTVLLSLGVEIITKILLNQFKHKKHVQRCTVKIKNMSSYEIALNARKAKEADWSTRMKPIIQQYAL